jgi:hypothetical protein
MASLTAPPTDGVVFLGESAATRRHGFQRGTVIVGIDGYVVHNMPQYFFVREHDGDNPRLPLVIWDGEAYSEVIAQVEGRRFVTEMETYPFVEKPGQQ